MVFEEDPESRRRVDPETQRERDAEIAELRRQGAPFRVIAQRMGMSLGAVQKSVKRAQKLSDAPATGEPGNVVAVVTDAGPYADELEDPDDWPTLNPVERWRFGHLTGRPVPLHDEDHKLCCLAHGLDPSWTPDDHGSLGHPWPDAEYTDDW